jgi:ABC-type phosphate transport system substrate-binding protein
MQQFPLHPLLVGLAAAIFAAPVQAQKIKLVANAAVDVVELPAATVARIFLKQEKKVGAGAASPVDQSKAAPPRVAFSTEILGRNVNAVETYWQQQVFSGKDTPPDAKASDEEVLAYVKATPGAIGYVSANAAVPSGVKIITIK